jgi:hypothetical protein
MIEAAHIPHRWASRKEAIAYARVGATTMNNLMRMGRIHAKKLDGKKVLVDLNSIDALYATLPNVGQADEHAKRGISATLVPVARKDRRRFEVTPKCRT